MILLYSIFLFFSFLNLFIFVQGSYTFTVGYHELSGTKMVLKKPLLVLKKKKRECDEDEESSSESLRRELEVVGVIRHRILFKTRPKALISSM